MIFQLVYLSTRTAQCTDSEIQNILAHCQISNQARGITGVLLYSDYKFVQFLEGDRTTVASLYNRIKLDRRHTNVLLLDRRTASERMFPSWLMGFKRVNIEDIELLSEASEQATSEFQEAWAAQHDSNVVATIRKFF